MKRTPAFSLTAATLALMISGATPALAGPLTESEMRSELLNKTLKGKRLGMTFVLQLSSDGHAKMQSTVKDDVGKWRINGQQMCLTWNEFRGGKENCATFSREKDGYRLQGGPLLRVVSGA
ncbi:hypothetical protein [Litoreibacter roseus]|uniref:Uncharacterized protein n=1 Tax=Litoreibacter roseus TaxID=2601869 RepID=A0A6N6JJE6_9RHOB|nr:hypothetical protein [Litoreibacter roseus]GFE66185.1 hypothetical protein KIN_32590 [Litoreibacter roseus]